ncbi:uncharacterized protein TNCV_3412561 [Trichonephila clavipes]|uniref:Uncharacterized protein n=1 Tax=Trichonephila clavipes TaxID=2585209 RepID=A0A8X6RF74_TRICX|nr:uncharacterized protein TNCV_3412561 [Trichonephila clavipes]
MSAGVVSTPRQFININSCRSAKNSSLNSDEDIRLSESDCEESEKKSDEIDNVPVHSDIYAVRDSLKRILHNSNAPGRFATRNVLRQSSRPTNFAKHNANVCFL